MQHLTLTPIHLSKPECSFPLPTYYANVWEYSVIVLMVEHVQIEAGKVMAQKTYSPAYPLIDLQGSNIIPQQYLLIILQVNYVQNGRRLTIHK